MSGFGKKHAKSAPSKNDPYSGAFDFDAARSSGRGSIDGGKVTTASGSSFSVCPACRHMAGRESALKNKCACCASDHEDTPKKSLLKNRQR